MEPSVVPPAAPAQPETISATRDAANRGDFNAFDKADHAARSGKPMPEVAATPDKPAAVAPPAVDPQVADPSADPAELKPGGERGVSKRQQAINDYERTIAELRLDNERLRSGAPAAPRSAPAAPPAAPALAADPTDLAPDHNDTTKYPDGVYDPKFIADQGAWGARQEFRKLQADASAREQQQHVVTTLRQRDSQFKARIDARQVAEPDFITKLHPDVRALKTVEDMKAENPDAEPGPLNDVCDFILRSDMPDTLMQHLSDHVDELQRFAALPSRQAVTFEMGVLVGQLKAGKPAAAASATPPAPRKLISDAPPPPPILDKVNASADPQASALQRGDFATFDKLEQQKRIAKLQPVASRG